MWREIRIGRADGADGLALLNILVFAHVDARQ
jgi:hypothetical protein